MPHPAQPFLESRSVAFNSAIHRGVIQLNVTFFHRLFRVAMANAIFTIPVHCPKAGLAGKMPPFEIISHSV
jgi:hypothetical protein